MTDAATGKAVACRIYIEGEKGTWHFPTSEAKAGAAIEYRKQRPDNPRSVEMHTTLSAHPFKKGFWNRSVIARRYAELGRWLYDRDHDGASPILGGGDADDGNPHIGPYSREIPGNGIDDNGIGGDLLPFARE